MRPVTPNDVRSEAERVALLALFARMDTASMAVALSITIALGMALATAALLIMGAPAGVPVGPNLAALATFLPGYSVTWPGCLVGAGYGAVLGAVLGFGMAVFWNFTHLIFLGVVALRGQRF